MEFLLYLAGGIVIAVVLLCGAAILLAPADTDDEGYL